MSDYEYDYKEADEQESETTLQSAREQLEFWTEFYEEEKEDKPDEWMFYRNPFLDPLKPHELKDAIATKESEK